MAPLSKKVGIAGYKYWHIVRRVLYFLVLPILLRSLFNREFESAFTCCLTLVLFAVPDALQRVLRVDFSPLLEGIIYCFIYAAEILGELKSFYTLIPIWDTVLHTINGFLMAAIGFCLVDLFNRSERFTFRLSPLFLALVAFCFSMTVGVLWEFFEFFMDMNFGTDMQKDWIVHTINSVKLNPSGLNKVQSVRIDSLIVNGEDWIALYGGYIDIGLIDTMKDLEVNFVGAVVFSVIGYFAAKCKGSWLAQLFIPRVLRKDEMLPEEVLEKQNDAEDKGRKARRAFVRKTHHQGEVQRYRTRLHQRKKDQDHTTR